MVQVKYEKILIWLKILFIIVPWIKLTYNLRSMII